MILDDFLELEHITNDSTIYRVKDNFIIIYHNIICKYFELIEDQYYVYDDMEFPILNYQLNNTIDENTTELLIYKKI
jgi:hypothetical protein